MSVRILTAVALLALGLAGCRSERVSADEPKVKTPGPPPRVVQVIPAAERTLPRTVSATGTLAADDQVVLGTKVAGRLAEITVDLGTRVQRGKVIGRLDQSDFRMRVDQAHAAARPQHRARASAARVERRPGLAGSSAVFQPIAVPARPARSWLR